MMGCLFLPATAPSAATDELRLYWQSLEGDGLNLTLSDCTQRLAGLKLALVVPMEVVTALTVELPTQKQRWLRKALPYTVEEWLTEDIESFHLALGEKNAEGLFAVRALDRQWLSDWLQRLEESGLHIAAIYLDADMLPLNGRTVLMQPERILIGGETDERMVVHPDAWAALQDRLSPFTPVETDSPYRMLAQGQQWAIDLAQEDFARAPERAWLGYAKPAALVLGLWLCLQMAFDIGQGWYYNQQSQQFHAASLASYRELFPEDSRIVNLRAQFDDHLQQGSFQGSALLMLLERFSSVMAEGDVSSLQVHEMAYSKSRGDLAVQMKAKDFSELDDLRQRLAATGLNVQMGSASREEQGVTARLIIGEGQ